MKYLYQKFELKVCSLISSRFSSKRFVWHNVLPLQVPKIALLEASSKNKSNVLPPVISSAFD